MESILGLHVLTRLLLCIHMFWSFSHVYRGTGTNPGLVTAGLEIICTVPFLHYSNPVYIQS